MSSDGSEPSTGQASLAVGTDATHKLRPPRKLGYSRPHHQPFSTSARNRSSVMALGRIDHLQHYFSKTERLVNRTGSYKPRSPERQISAPRVQSQLGGGGSDHQVMGEPLPLEEDVIEDDLNEAQAAPLPPSPVLKEFAESVKEDVDPARLRKELDDQIGNCTRSFVLYDISNPTHPVTSSGLNIDHKEPSQLKDRAERENEQFIALLDSLTYCIRSARTYSTRIPTHQSLAMSFSVFREDALLVLSHLRDIANRNAVSLTPPTIISETERQVIKLWLEEVAEYLENENCDNSIISEAMNWIRPELWSYSSIASALNNTYLDLDDRRVSDGELKRFQSLLSCYSEYPIPSILEDTYNFLDVMKDGLKLCLIYNAIVRRSAKPFGLITRYHEDTTIKYRVTDNLRFWRAALSYRFGLLFTDDDLDVQSIWTFDALGQKQLFYSIVAFCRVVIDETAEYMAASGSEKRGRDLDSQVDALAI